MIEEIYNYLKLDERVATAGQPTEAQLADIAAAGYRMVINLAHPDNDRALKDEPGVVEGLGMEYIAIPVVWRAPTREDFERFCRAMDANRDRSVFVHCAANKRVSVFMALYRTLRLGWKWEDAYIDVDRVWTPPDWWKEFIAARLDDAKLKPSTHSGIPQFPIQPDAKPVTDEMVKRLEDDELDDF